MIRPVSLAWLLTWLSSSAPAAAPSLRGLILDADTEKPVAARLYIHGDVDDSWHHAQSDGGVAVPYDRRREPRSVEVHTSLTAHPFTADLTPGNYTLTVEHGKEYHTFTTKVVIPSEGETVDVRVPLKRWSNIATQGWYSGETHVHRTVDELPTLVQAEDLNVSFPLTAWVTDSTQSPSKENKNPQPVPLAKLIKVDPTHVIWPINTEYEIFSIKGKSHTLGAVFILNHRESFTMPAPPVEPIAAEARRQGALLDLDKHNWPWSMMLIPNMGVQLYELTNNHLWRTEFLYADWYPEYAADYMQIPMMKNGNFTERGWIDFGLQNYYALLNCGFDIKPTAGTASGVHPVHLGFGRVYVKIDGEFRYQKWIDGLAAGQSFVTTGPMLITETKREGDTVSIRGEASSSSPLGAIEVVVNGAVASTVEAQPYRTEAGAWVVSFETSVPLQASSWIATRVFEARLDERPRFAHSAPVHFKVADKPLRPRKAEVLYLIKRVQDEITRHDGVLEENAMAEYREALRFYQNLLETAVTNDQ